MTNDFRAPQFDPNLLTPYTDTTAHPKKSESIEGHITCSRCGKTDVPDWDGNGHCISCARDEVLGSESIEVDEPTITLNCCNCYNEKSVNLLRIGTELKQFFDEHKTRIGNRYCKIQDIGMRYNPFQAECNRARIEALYNQRMEKERKEDAMGRYCAVCYKPCRNDGGWMCEEHGYKSLYISRMEAADLRTLLVTRAGINKKEDKL